MTQLHESIEKHGPPDVGHTPQDQGRDTRLEATKSIWSSTIWLMGISVPLTAITKDFSQNAALLIPFSVMAGSVVGTVAVWNPFARRTPVNTQSDKQVQQHEERIASLEMILNYEEKLIESKAQRQAQLISQAPSQGEAQLQSESQMPYAVVRDRQPSSTTATTNSNHEYN